MAGILLDTNVISEITKPRPEPRVAAFLAQATDPWLSTISIHELTYGAERVRDVARRAKLLGWVAQIGHKFSGRIVTVTTEIAEQSGRLRAAAEAEGRAADPLDALIAASAFCQGLTLATRNVRDFQMFGIALVNPWDEAPSRPTRER